MVNASLPHSSLLAGPRSRVASTAIVAGCCLAAALAVQEYFTRHWGGGPRQYSTMLFAQAIGAALWLAFIPLIVRPITAHIPITRLGFVRHIVTGCLVAALHTLLVATLFASYYYPGSVLAIGDVFRDRMHTTFTWSVAVYLILVGLFLLRRMAPVAAASVEPGGELETEQRLPGALRRVLVRTGGRVLPINVEQIDWLEAADNHVIVHVGGATHSVRGALSVFAERLDPETFVRIHRGAIVNVNRIREVQTWFHGELVAILRDETRVTVGRTYRDAFMTVLEG
jgi:hypothetical protein